MSFPPQSEHSVHCTLMAVDINGFGDLRRTGTDLQHLRRSLRAMLHEALEQENIPKDLYTVEGFHDCVLIVASSAIPAGIFVDGVFTRLRTLLRRYNDWSAELFKIRLRMALHAGHVFFDEDGAVGPAVNYVLRLLTAPDFKNAFGSSADDLGLVVSSYIYEEVVRDERGGIVCEDFKELLVDLKEIKVICWVSLRTSPVPLNGFAASRAEESDRSGQSQPA